jgi:hypothetical protein
VYEQTPYRGYLSTIQLNAHFGLDSIASIDSMVIKWPDGAKEVLTGVAVDRTINIDKKNAKGVYDWRLQPLATNALFRDVTDSLGRTVPACATGLC